MAVVELAQSEINGTHNSIDAQEQLSDLTSSLAIHNIDAAGLTNVENSVPRDDPRRVFDTRRTFTDDLIPQSDPCYLNLKLRNRSVDLLQLVTARTILRFVLSLMEDEELTLFSQKNTPNRDSVIQSVQKNQECLARHSRSETQLIIGQYLLSTREEIFQNFDKSLQPNGLDDDNDLEDNSIQSLETELNERNVSDIVEEKLSNLISHEFKTYSYVKDLDRDHASSMTKFNSIDLVKISKLMNFYGQVFYWNKFFDLIFDLPLPSQ